MQLWISITILPHFIKKGSVNSSTNKKESYDAVCDCKFKGIAVCQRNTDRKSLSVDRKSHLKADV